MLFIIALGTVANLVYCAGASEGNERITGGGGGGGEGERGNEEGWQVVAAAALQIQKGNK